MNSEPKRPLASEDLLHRALSGDHLAFGALVDRHTTQLSLFIQRHAKRVLGGDCSAEDLLQSVLIAAWQSLPNFEDRGPGAFYAWLLQVARHTISARIRYVRAKGRERVCSLESPPGSTDAAARDIIETMTSIASRASRNEQIARLEAAMQELPEQRRRVFALSYVEGLPLRQIATRLGISKSAAWDQLRAAIDRLRSILNESGGL